MIFEGANKINFMIIGKAREAEAHEYDEDQLGEEYYYHNLESFWGVEGHAYGIRDELHDLGKMIELIGEVVMKVEKEFREVEKADADLEYGFPGEEVLKAWHKKMIRPFSYKQLMMGIHTTFNNGMVSLYALLVAERRIADTVHAKNRNVIDILKELQTLDLSLPGLLAQVRGFNFIRNRVTHEGGYYNESTKDITAFRNVINGRMDIQVEQLRFPDADHTHRMTIIRSSVLMDYITVIRKVFEGLLKGAHQLGYITPSTPVTGTTRADNV
jgi:hypothetical protein